MSSQNPDTTAVKVESSTENEQSQEQRDGQQEGQHGPQKFGNQRRGAGNRFGGPRGGGRFNKDSPRGPPRNEHFGQRRPGGGPGGPHHERGQGGDFPRNPFDKISEKLSQMCGPTLDLPPLDLSEKKFSGRNRLYVGNIGNELSEEELVEFFKPYGEITEVFLNKEKNFAFVKFDFKSNAERAKRELDGQTIKGRTLKLRFAPSSATIKVRNLTPHVSNELLYIGFQIFGEIERALICVDERGKPTGEGIVEFIRKGSALSAIRHCNEHCFFLTASLRPCIVEAFEVVEEQDGFPEKSIIRRNPEFMKAREIGPRFAQDDTFEHEYGMRWKSLYDLYSQKEQALKKELEMEKEKLEAQMEFARYEHETEMLREQLRHREMDRERQKREWEMKERQAEEQRVRTEEQMRRQEEEMQARMVHQEEEMRRRQQENNLFMQAHQLDNMLNQQEQAYDRPFNNDSNSGVTDPKTFLSNYERGERFDNRENNMGRNANNRGGHWVNESRRDDYPVKRRRF